MIRRAGSALTLATAPATALASDPSALWFLFLELPALVLACICLLLTWPAPRAGRALAVIHAAIAFVLLVWMSSDGGPSSLILAFALLVDIAAVVAGSRRTGEHEGDGTLP